ncbi:MAG: hypothetical protein AAFY39_00965 [Pseudomonadota bacterium]
MAQQFVSARMAARSPDANATAAPATGEVRTPGPLRTPEVRDVFATRAYAQFLSALGWQLPTLSRHEMEHHAPLQCCFVLRDGDREEAAFGYTAVTMPDDTNCPGLAKARSHIERFLARLGEDSGLLFQNTPVFAFAGRRRDRIAVFGGWRIRRGTWTPFLLGPDGLGGLAGQEMLFARGTAPHHMAEVCGHEVRTVMPRITDLTHAIDAFGQNDKARDAAETPEPARRPVQIVPLAGGWFTARPDVSGTGNPVVFKRARAVAARPKVATVPPSDTLQAFGEDEFRFHEFGADRR